MSQRLTLRIDHAGPTVVEMEVEPAPGELSTANNRAVVTVNGVRDRLRVLLVSGQPHPGERVWRNLLKSDPSVDLVHFTILRPPDRRDLTPIKELSLIAFPVKELFETKLQEFDLIVFDRYVVRGVLSPPYWRNVARYVRKGGAALFAVGPEHAGPESIAGTPLSAVMPVEPSGAVVETRFRPTLTEAGRRHPVTAALGGAEGTWGHWFRHVQGAARSGHVLMEGPGGPLLVLDRMGKGRVAEMMSDHVWLWARRFEGGGPHAELVRRLAHWLMREPDLEEERLTAHVGDGKLVVERRSLGNDNPPVTVTAPSGAEMAVPLAAVGPGRARAEVGADETGLYRIDDGARTVLAASGPTNPAESADLRATPEKLAPTVEAAGGGIRWLAEGLPDFRRVRPGRAAAGAGWLGLVRNDSHVVTGAEESPLLPGLVLVAMALAALVAAWWREGRF